MLVEVELAGQGLVDAPPPVWREDGWVDPITNPDWLEVPPLTGVWIRSRCCGRCRTPRPPLIRGSCPGPRSAASSPTRRLCIAQRRVRDAALVGTIAQGRDRGEPDRVVEVCGDIVARLDTVGQARLEDAQDGRSG